MDRVQFVAGLRALADLLEHDSSLPLPYHGGDAHLAVFVYNSEARDRYVAALSDVTVEDVPEDEHFPHRALGRLNGLKILIYERAADNGAAGLRAAS